MKTFLVALFAPLFGLINRYMLGTGMLATIDAATAADFAAGRVTNPNQSEVIRQSLYDFQLYPTAGQTSLNFFSAPAGQGIASAIGSVVGSAKSLADTNLVLPNQLPSGAAFLIESIEVVFMPGSVSTANTYTPANVSLFNATAAAAVAGQLNDVNTVLQSGTLELNILQKNYLRETPLHRFPPKTYIDHTSAVASNSATTAEVALANGRAVGRPYYLDPPVTLQPAVNFGVVINWPGVVATPSGFNARIGVILDGFTMRASQ